MWELPVLIQVGNRIF